MLSPTGLVAALRSAPFHLSTPFSVATTVDVLARHPDVPTFRLRPSRGAFSATLSPGATPCVSVFRNDVVEAADVRALYAMTGRLIAHGSRCEIVGTVQCTLLASFATIYLGGCAVAAVIGWAATATAATSHRGQDWLPLALTSSALVVFGYVIVAWVTANARRKWQQVDAWLRDLLHESAVSTT